MAVVELAVPGDEDEVDAGPAAGAHGVGEQGGGIALAPMFGQGAHATQRGDFDGAAEDGGVPADGADVGDDLSFFDYHAQIGGVVRAVDVGVLLYQTRAENGAEEDIEGW